MVGRILTEKLENFLQKLAGELCHTGKICCSHFTFHHFLYIFIVMIPR